MVRSRFNKVMSIAAELVLWIGGIDNSRAHRRFSGDPAEGSRRPIPDEMQRQALGMLLDILRPTNAGLQPPLEGRPFLVREVFKQLDSFGGTASVDLAEDVRYMQEAVTERLLNTDRLQQVSLGEELGGLAAEELLASVVDLFNETLTSTAAE